jgi:hypothetical protein
MPVLFEAPSTKKQSFKKGKHPVKTVNASKLNTTPLTAYLMHPNDIRFETQDSDEEVILFMRQHIIVLIPKLILGVVVFLVPPVLFPFLIRFLQSPVEIPAGYVMVGTVFWYVATFGYFLTMFMQWYFNIFIVTNHRIIDIDFLFFLYKKFGEAKIEKIQDISFRTGGIMATMFNFGDVVIQTAGELPNLIFEKVPRPSDVVHILSDLTENQNGEINV